MWMFEPKGKIEISSAVLPADAELALIDAGMDDTAPLDNGLLLYSAPDKLESLKTAAERLGLTVSEAEVVSTPKKQSLATVDDAALTAFLTDLEALDDVTNVTTNAA